MEISEHKAMNLQQTISHVQIIWYRAIIFGKTIYQWPRDLNLSHCSLGYEL